MVKITLGVSVSLPIIAAVIIRQPTTLVLGVLSLCLLYIGYISRQSVSAYASCATTYYPLSTLFGVILPESYSYLLSATILTLLAERLSFEFSLRNTILGGGADKEAYNSAMRLTKEHSRMLGLVALGVLVCALVSYTVSMFNPGALPVLAS
ncbi:MAG: hypothetical protein QW429_00760, partial [Thermoprotei archaeon]